MHGNSKRENRESLLVSDRNRWPAIDGAERSANTSGGGADMNINRQSDEPVVPATSANKGAAEASAESTEERG